MKKNILIISIICLLTITIGYTYSAFKNTIKGTITATTNNWKFSASVPSGIKENNYYKVFINNNSGSFDIVLDNIGSEYYAEYTIELETVNLPTNFVLNDKLYEGTLSGETKTISVSYSSSSSVNGYIKVIAKAVKAEVSFMKNGYGYPSGTEFWSDTYRQYIRTITFGNDLTNLPSACTEENLCWDITDNSNKKNKVYGYLTNSGIKDSSSNILYNLNIVSEYTIMSPVSFSCSHLFYGFSNLKYINFNNNFKTSNATYMGGMFRDCSSLESLDLSSLDTSNVTGMNYMFMDCSQLTELNLSNFDTSKVTDMYDMFSGCASLMSLDVSSFDTSKVTNMSWMFSECSSLTSLSLTNFNTSKVTDMSNMFNECSSLTSLSLSSFNTSNVSKMSRMFWNCSSLTKLDLSNFNTSNVEDMEYMFNDCSKLANLDLSSFNTSKVTNMECMFNECRALIELDLSSFDTSNVEDMDFMFYNCDSLTKLNLSNFNTSNVRSTYQMFYNCSSVTTEITIMNARITSYDNMFYGSAITSGSKITINYILNASSLVDSMIATKSSNSNIVKGSIIPEYTITITGNDDITYESPNTVKGTTVTLISISGNYLITSFKMNGALIEGNTFTMPSGNVTITDIMVVECTIFETDHFPYLNDQSNVIVGEKTFEGATSLTVILDYQTESSSWDYFYIYDSATSTTGINNNKKYGGSTRTTETITINSNYIKITFTSDSYINAYYGLKATIIPNY